MTSAYLEPVDAVVSRLVVVWESDASGDATIELDGKPHPMLAGVVDRVVAVPDPTDTPTSGYDAVLETDTAADLLEGLLADLATSTTTRWVYRTAGGTHAELEVAEPTRLVISNAGNAKAGVLVFYVLTRP